MSSTDAAEVINNNNNKGSAPLQEHANVNLAFVVSYVGTPFQGSQIQSHHHPVNTVEGLLIAALDKINLIDANILQRYEKVKDLRNKKQYNNNTSPQNQFRSVPPQLGLGRTSRTDRGVSALCNVFNMYCKKSTIKKYETTEKLMQAANEAIHSLVTEYFTNTIDADGEEKAQQKQERPILVVQALQEVPQNFFGRFCANRRVYRYLIPAFALDPPRSKTLPPLPGSWTFQSCAGESSEQSKTTYKRIFTSEEEAKLVSSSANPQEDPFAYYATRAEKGNEVLKKFIGYHRFHNYTGREIKSNSKMETAVLGKDSLHACDQETLRNIYRAEVLPVPLFVKTPSSTTKQDEHLYIPHYIFQIDGGSFLLHMIRKIVGTMIAVVRGAREDLIELSLSPEKIVSTPMAPARYLCQSRVFFESYEQLRPEKFQQKNLPFLSTSIEAANAEMEKFESESIFAEMVHLDVTSKSMFVDAPPDEIAEPQSFHTKEQLDLLARQKKNKEQKAALETLSEMRRFVRMCPMHNWAVAENPEQYRPKPKVDKEEKKKARQEQLAKRRQRENDDDDNDNEDDGAGGNDGDENENNIEFEDFSGDVAADVDVNQEGKEQKTEEGNNNNNNNNGGWLDKGQMSALPRVQFAWNASWMTVDDVTRRNNGNK